MEGGKYLLTYCPAFIFLHHGTQTENVIIAVAQSVQIRPVGLPIGTLPQRNSFTLSLSLSLIDRPRPSEHYVLAFNALSLSLVFYGIIVYLAAAAAAVWWENFVCQNKSLRNRA